jgi:hypothetical protein
MRGVDRECSRTRELCVELTRLGALCHVVQADGVTVGWPDRHVTHRLWCGWLEMKFESSELSRRQAARLRELNDRQPGGAFVVRHREAGGYELWSHDGRTCLAACANAGQLLLALAACSDMRFVAPNSAGNGLARVMMQRHGAPSFVAPIGGIDAVEWIEKTGWNIKNAW